MKRVGEILEQGTLFDPGEIRISTRQVKKTNLVALVRASRESHTQEVAYNSRPFVLCSLPIRRLPRTITEYKRKNGNLTLEIIGHPRLGLPFGQDRLITIWVASLALGQRSRTIVFDTGSQILRAFGLPLDGKTYCRLIDGFKRIFGATIFFGEGELFQAVGVQYEGRYHFFDSIRLWYSKSPDEPMLPGEDFKNTITLSEYFWDELQRHPIPVDLNAVRALTDSPGNLDFYMWLCWRCWTAQRTKMHSAKIPLFGKNGLCEQLGTATYTRPRRFQQQIKNWLDKCMMLWPECPARLTRDGNLLIMGGIGSDAVHRWSKPVLRSEPLFPYTEEANVGA